MRKVIAIACADIHLQLTPPRCRAKEPDWFAAMQRPLDEIRELANNHNAPVLCAGDVFDKWNSPPELINWASKYLPTMYAIPGQHDLPQHNYNEMEKSAYKTMLETGRIINIIPGSSDLLTFWVYGYPWGFPVEKLKYKPSTKSLNIALIHEYNWIKGHSYPNAPKEQMLSRKRKWLSQFDVVIFGDNHKGFQYTYLHGKGSTNIFNCGTLMRRKSDEINYKPQVGLIMDDGGIRTHYLDCSKDVIDIDVADEQSTTELDVTDFMEALEGLVQNPLDFRLAAEQYFIEHKTPTATQHEFITAMEKE